MACNRFQHDHIDFDIHDNHVIFDLFIDDDINDNDLKLNVIVYYNDKYIDHDNQYVDNNDKYVFNDNIDHDNQHINNDNQHINNDNQHIVINDDNQFVNDNVNKHIVKYQYKYDSLMYN